MDFAQIGYLKCRMGATWNPICWQLIKMFMYVHDNDTNEQMSEICLNRSLKMISSVDFDV